MKNSPPPPSTRELKRVRFLGVAIALAGLGLLCYGGLSLMGIYNQERHMIVLEAGLSPEKGRFWVNCLTGASLMLIGIALRLKAGGDPENRRHK